MKYVRQIVAGILLLLLGAALLVVVVNGSGLSLRASDDLSRADFVSIILTALGVMLTAVTVFLGALAIIGWATFEARVKQSSEAFLERRFSEDDPRYIALVEDLKRESLKGTRQSYLDENESTFTEDAE